MCLSDWLDKAREKTSILEKIDGRHPCRRAVALSMILCDTFADSTFNASSKKFI